MIRVPNKGEKFTLQDAQTTGNGNVAATPPVYVHHTIFIVGGAGVSAGAVTVESAHDPEYTGTWKTEIAAVTVVAGAVLTVKLVGAYVAIRARISTTVVDGTVTCIYVGA